MTSEVLQQLDLSQSALGQNLLTEHICDLFDGNAFVGLRVDCGTASVLFISQVYWRKIKPDKPRECSSRRGKQYYFA